MRIGVDLAPLNSPLTGVGNYTYYLLGALLRAHDAPTIDGFGNLNWKPVQSDYFDEKHSSAESLIKKAAGIGWLRQSSALRKIYGVLRRKAFETSAVGKSLSLFHAFAYVPPGQLKVPTIPVVYDLSFIRFPDLHPAARIRALSTLDKHIRNAPGVHTISRFSAEEIVEVYGVQRSLITVIHPGVKPIFFGPPFTATETLRRYELTTQRYFLVVSTLEPRKNLRTLVSAYWRIPQTLRAQFPLCIVGGEGWNRLDLPRGFSDLQNEGSLRFLGFVPDSDLKSLYQHARAMLYPSTYEGFGMPIIEALASGTAVVCSNTTSMPEAGGPVVRTVAPLDVEGWTEEFSRAVDGYLPDQRGLRQAHAAHFTWERAARQTIDFYAEILAR